MLMRVLDRLGLALKTSHSAGGPQNGTGGRHADPTEAHGAAGLVSHAPSIAVGVAAHRGPNQSQSVAADTPRAAPNLPIIGTLQRGLVYADEFAAEFVSWVRLRSGQSVTLSASQLLGLAEHRFSPAAGLAMPPDRNLLGALKRQAGVTSRANVRVRDHRGQLIGKTTMYEIARLDADTADAGITPAPAAARAA